MGNTKKYSIVKKILYTLLILVIGIAIGYKFFGTKSSSTPILQNTNLYRGVTSSNPSDSTKVSEPQEFTGKIFEVKDGDLIQDAVKKAKPGDLIRVYPGTYSETIYVDKDNLTFQGVIEEGEWPVLDGKKELNDAFLYSGNKETK